MITAAATCTADLGWVAVMPNPFFGVTGADGTTRSRTSRQVTVEVWHVRPASRRKSRGQGRAANEGRDRDEEVRAGGPGEHAGLVAAGESP
jgi:hypothetical protein